MQAAQSVEKAPCLRRILKFAPMALAPLLMAAAAAPAPSIVPPPANQDLARTSCPR